MQDINNQLTSLKDGLKVWEKNFANSHGGRKATREDIKADPAIARKYKEYNQLRDPSNGKSAQQTPKKRKPTSHQYETPRKKPSKAAAKSTVSRLEEHRDSYKQDHPDALSPTKSPPCVIIGPTPQKDGVVLGLFDNIPFTTPRRNSRTILGEVEPNVLQTPSKIAAQGVGETPHTLRKLSRTPLSTGKRFLLDTFATPSKRKLEDEGTPFSAKRLATPNFLRRCSRTLDTVAEEEQDGEAVRPWQRRSFGRSLSSMIQDMRKKEDDQFDDEMEAMRELENESNPLPAAKVGAEDGVPAQPLETDNDLEPLGNAGDTKDEGETHGQRKQWKKKGQKRTTKRVIMRPVRTRPKKVSGTQTLHGDSEDDSGTDQDGGDKSDAEYGSPPNDEASSDVENKRQKKPKKPKAKQKSEERKINPNAVAHANFKSLKIKNKNSKGKGRGFRRR